MIRNIFNIHKVVGLTIVLGVLSACDSAPKSDRTDTYSSGEISFYCDESFSPIIDEEIQIFELMYSQAKVNAVYTNENESVDSLMSLGTRLAITTRRLTAAEEQNLRDRTYNPRAIPLAYDGLALIVNNSNPDSCITIKDIKRILSGEAKEWKDIYPNSKLGALDVVFDNPESSTVRFCVDSLLDGKPINSPNIEAVNKSEEVINYVSRHENAIGVIGSNWLNDKRDTTNVTFKKEIKVMGVSKMETATPKNSWKPYQYYLYNGNYPLVRTIYALLNDPYNGLAWGFGQFIASPKGQLIIFQSGLLPVQGNMTVRDVNVNRN